MRRDGRYKDPEVVIANMRNAKSCGKMASNIMYNIDGIGYRSCLCTFRTHRYPMYWEMYENYQKGNLPYPGTFMEQPSKAIEIIKLIQGLVAEQRAEEYKKQEKALARNGRR